MIHLNKLVEPDEIVTPGERVKRIRKSIGANQEDIAGKGCTRNQISNIETGTSELTKIRAESICKNINEYVENNKIEIFGQITVEYLMVTEEQQALNIFNNHYEKLEKIMVTEEKDKFIDEINIIEILIHEYSMPIKYTVMFYNMCINFFYKICEFELYDKYILKNFELATIRGDYIKAIECVKEEIRKYIDINKDYNRAIEIGKYAIDYIEKKGLKTNIKSKIYFNIALSYKKLNNLEGLKWLEKVNKDELEEENQIKVDVLLIKFKILNKDYKTSINVCKELIKKAMKIGDANSIMMVYGTLADVYMNYGKLDKAKESIDYAVSIKNVNDKIILQDTFFIGMKISDKVKSKYEEMFHFFYEAYRYSNELKEDTLKIEVANFMIDYCIRSSEENILNIFDRVLAYANMGSFMGKELSTICLKIANYYSKIDSKKSLYVIEKGFNIIKRN